MKKNYQTLLLNSDHTPIKPITWQKAINLIFKNKATQINFYQDDCIRAGHGKTYPIPSIIVLNKYVKKPRNKPSFSKRNIFIRDGFFCSYCITQFKASELTLDHVHPKSKGGKRSWLNIATACIRCNKKKGDRSCEDAGMLLHIVPYEPTSSQIFAGMFEFHMVDDSWLIYLPGALKNEHAQIH